MARKLGLGANALTRPERMAKEWRQLGTGGPRGGCDAETASYLPKYLGLSDDHRIQAGGDAKKVRRGCVGAMRVQALIENEWIDAAALDEDVPDRLCSRVLVVARCVYLDAVTGREDDRLRDRILLHESPQCVGRVLRRNRRALE